MLDYYLISDASIIPALVA